MSNATELPSKRIQSSQTSDLIKAGRHEEYKALKEHFRQLRSQRREQPSQPETDKKPPVTTVVADTKTRKKHPLAFAGVLLNNDKFMSNLRGSIELASIPAPKIDAPNPRSLAAALATYPELRDSFDPDLENIMDAQQSFETLVNRSVAVYELVNNPNVNVGTIEY